MTFALLGAILVWVAAIGLGIAAGWTRLRTFFTNLGLFATQIALIPLDLAERIARELLWYTVGAIVACSGFIFIGIGFGSRVTVAIGFILWLIVLGFWLFCAEMLANYLTFLLSIANSLKNWIVIIGKGVMRFLGVLEDAAKRIADHITQTPAQASSTGQSRQGGNDTDHAGSGGATTQTDADRFPAKIRKTIHLKMGMISFGSAFTGVCLVAAPYWETLGAVTLFTFFGLALVAARPINWWLRFARFLILLVMFAVMGGVTYAIADHHRGDMPQTFQAAWDRAEVEIEQALGKDAKEKFLKMRDGKLTFGFAPADTYLFTDNKAKTYSSPDTTIRGGTFVEFVNPAEAWRALIQQVAADPEASLTVKVRTEDTRGLLVGHVGYVLASDIEPRSQEDYRAYREKQQRAKYGLDITPTSPPVSVLKKVRGIMVPAGETKPVPIPLEEKDNVFVFSQPDYPGGKISLTVDENTIDLYTYKYPFVAGPNSVLQVHNGMEDREASLLVYNFGTTPIPDVLKNRVVRMVTVVVSNPGAREVIVNCLEPYGNESFPCERLPAVDQVWDIFFPSDYSLVFTTVDGKELTRVDRPLNDGMRVKIP